MDTFPTCPHRRAADIVRRYLREVVRVTPSSIDATVTASGVRVLAIFASDDDAVIAHAVVRRHDSAAEHHPASGRLAASVGWTIAVSL